MATPINVNTQIPASQLKGLQDINNASIYAENVKSVNKSASTGEEIEVSDVADFELNQTSFARFEELLGQVDGSEESLSELATMFASTPKELIAIASGDFSEVAEVQAFNQALASARSLASNPEAGVSQDEVIDLAVAMVLGRNAPSQGGTIHSNIERPKDPAQIEAAIALLSGNIEPYLSSTYQSTSAAGGTTMHIEFDLKKMQKETGLPLAFLENLVLDMFKAAHGAGSTNPDGSHNSGGIYSSKIDANGKMTVDYLAESGQYLGDDLNTPQKRHDWDMKSSIAAYKNAISSLYKEDLAFIQASVRSFGLDLDTTKTEAGGQWSVTDMNVADMLVFVNMLRMRMQESQIKDQVLGLKANVASAEELGKLKAAVSSLRLKADTSSADNNKIHLSGEQIKLFEKYGIDYKANVPSVQTGTINDKGDFVPDPAGTPADKAGTAVQLSFVKNGQNAEKTAEKLKEWCDSLTQDAQTRIDSMNSTQQIQMISLQKWNSTRNESGETASNFLSKFQQLNSQIISKIGQ